ncbi:winged helix-turn-helix domain-containing protein [Coraliomargarita algicola]|uniref:Winged helix-turn-helix domain-containing protein n=1 Tax=Coraliomargarita algicola TaxID=3092156 RepID=A0ABZ0RPP4_9BACT|nr:winged helix-turn-helix domain-containing protein [Coraliomargarita sp. J2-16]WPJ96710.1 winged helix-turn-helix domain-containing protein [Coraliomargarita sp. J2-16]
MTQPTRRRGRPADRREAIYQELVHRIVQGHYPPMQQLPTLRDIASEFNASSRTVQAVFKDLAESGFTDPQGARGTFVHEDPPHLHRHLLIHDGTEQKNRFRTALLAEADKLNQAGWSIEIVHLPVDSQRSSLIQELSHRVERQQYAGIAFTSDIKELIHTPLYTTPSVPRVVLSPHMQTFSGPYQPDFKSSPLFNQTLHKLQQLGARRVGAFLHATKHKNITQLHKGLIAHQFETKNAWLHSIHHSMDWEAYAVMELLLSQPPSKRPDTLLIYDDHLTEMVTKGLHDFGSKLKPITVISHCNFPMKPKTHTPVIWFGYNANEILLRAFQLIEQERRQPSQQSRQIRLTPYFEDER